MLTIDDVLGICRLEHSVAELATRYQTATPFPHIVIDDLLHPDVLEAAYREFDNIGTGAWTNYLHLNERKFAATDPTTWGCTLRAIADAFCSDRFVSFLENLTGLDDLLADPSMDGGGLHRSVRGGFLNVHADFTAHHTEPHWQRRVNLLLYLTRAWDDAWGGALELWPPDMRERATAIPPRGNRMVLFTTSDTSYHGHPEPMMCPDEVARQSLALYFFTEEAGTHVRSTNYRARPTDSRSAAARIAVDNQLLHAYDAVKRRLHLSDRMASRWLGASGRFFRK